jgi:hypothetical protein
MSALPATARGVQRRRTDIPHVVGNVDRDPRWDDLVDVVHYVARQSDPVGGEVAFQVLHGPRTDNGDGDCGMTDGKCDRRGLHLNLGDLVQLRRSVAFRLPDRIELRDAAPRVCRNVADLQFVTR